MPASVLKRDLKNLIQRNASLNFQAQNGLLSLRSWWRSVRSLQKRLSVSPRGHPWGVSIDKTQMPGGFFGRVSRLRRSLHPDAPAFAASIENDTAKLAGTALGQFSGSGGGASNDSVVMPPTRSGLLTRCDVLGYCSGVRRPSQTVSRSGKHSGWCKTH